MDPVRLSVHYLRFFAAVFLLAFTPAAGAQITPIADIQGDPAGFLGTIVTVEGQVYIPSDYRQPDTSIFSAYIQGESGRGINVFGFSSSLAGDPALLDCSHRVRITGEIDAFFTTIEIVNLTEVVLLSAGNWPILPLPLSTGAANSSQWEGTYIQVVGTIVTSSLAGPGRNYLVDDGSGWIVVRVVDTLGAPVFGDGTPVVAAGAGGQFRADFHIFVGKAEAFTTAVPTESSTWGELRALYSDR